MEKDKYYESRYTFDKGRKKVWRAICEYISKYIQGKNYTIVDIGAGYCDFINQIEAANKIAIDSNAESKKFCGENIDFYSSFDSFFETEKKEGKNIDIFFMSNLLEHLTDTEAQNLLRSIYDCLNNNGKVIIIQPNYYYAYREYWDDYTHLKAYTHTSLMDLLKSIGFKIERCEKRFLPFTMKSILPKTYILTKLYLNLPMKPFAKQMLIIADKKNRHV
jgi:SAM-dependent methyltransferase